MDIPEPEWYKQTMPATSEFENQEKITKSVGYLDIEEAIKL
jgi:hypothetical protein